MNEIDDYPDNSAFEPKRKPVSLKDGNLVQKGSDVYRISQALDFESVIGVHVETGKTELLRINELSPFSGSDSIDQSIPHDISEIADEDWKIAEKRFAAIQPLLNNGFTVGRQQVESRAKEIGVNTATLYRWLKRYRAYGFVAALIPQKRGWKKGRHRISVAADEIIVSVINDFYLTKQRPNAQKAVTEVLRICHEREIESPHPTTIRARLSEVSEKNYLRGRGYREKAKNKFLPAAGRFPNADYPLSVVQIDHTPADIILVDDKYRKPIGRPWISLAIDVYSRMVTGYYLSFDPPSETSVAMCVAHSILPKEEWLLLHEVDSEWPVWGVPVTIHVDNGADFRSDNFQKSCLMYGINLEFRPVKQPQYGGHIERMLGTLLKEIHALPGTTFSSIKEKDDYESEKHAAMTITEFETWLVTLICKVYHQRIHNGIGIPPLKKWEIGVFGNAETQGIGVPSKPADRMTVLLDFLPGFSRTIQTFGVTIDGITYYAEPLRPWINAEDPENKKEKRKFVFRRDPRDISSIWFYDPELKQYFQIPYADQSLPSMSVWEYNQAKQKLKREGIENVNEHKILEAITELREQVEKSVEKTKKARRMNQRRKEHEKKINPGAPLKQETKTEQKSKKDTSVLNTVSGLIDGDIDSFDDIA